MNFIKSSFKNYIREFKESWRFCLFFVALTTIHSLIFKIEYFLATTILFGSLLTTLAVFAIMVIKSSKSESQ